MKQLAFAVMLASFAMTTMVSEAPAANTERSVYARGQPSNDFEITMAVPTNLEGIAITVMHTEVLYVLETRPKAILAEMITADVNGPGLSTADRKVRDVDLCSFVAKYKVTCDKRKETAQNCDKRKETAQKLRLPRGALRCSKNFLS